MRLYIYIYIGWFPTSSHKDELVKFQRAKVLLFTLVSNMFGHNLGSGDIPLKFFAGNQQSDASIELNKKLKLPSINDAQSGAQDDAKQDDAQGKQDDAQGGKQDGSKRLLTRIVTVTKYDADNKKVGEDSVGVVLTLTRASTRAPWRVDAITTI